MEPELKERIRLTAELESAKATAKMQREYGEGKKHVTHSAVVVRILRKRLGSIEALRAAVAAFDEKPRRKRGKR